MALTRSHSVARMVNMHHSLSRLLLLHVLSHCSLAHNTCVCCVVCLCVRAHYEVHKPEPHVLLFRRPLGTDPRTGALVGKENRGDSQNIQQQQQSQQQQQHNNDTMQDAQ